MTRKELAQAVRSHEVWVRTAVRTKWLTRMTARRAISLTDEQREQLGMQPPPRARNARQARTIDLARRLGR